MAQSSNDVCLLPTKESFFLLRLVFVVSRTGACAPVLRFSQVDLNRLPRSAEFGAWLRWSVRVGFRTHPDGLEGSAYSVSRPPDSNLGRIGLGASAGTW